MEKENYDCNNRNTLQTFLNSVQNDDSWFYGSRQPERNVIAQKIEQSLEKKRKVALSHVHSKKLKRLTGPSISWKVFHKQEEAINYARKNSNDKLLVFVYETYDGRKFLVAHPETFWYYYNQDIAEKHAYEIILEHNPCKLYFDIEYYVEFNREKDGREMLETFTELARNALKMEWNIDCDSRDILDLDSSTNEKFSHHLIFQLGDAVFKDNYNVGFFVRDLCSEINIIVANKGFANLKLNLLSDCRVPFERVEELLVLDKKNTRRLFVDECVYTKNRHFRIYLSSKRQKNAKPLVLSPANKFARAPDSPNIPTEEYIFLKSLISLVSPNLRILTYKMSRTRKLEIENKCANNKIINNDKVSPYPSIDNIIKEIIKPGVVRKLTYFPESKLIKYDIIGNRFCGNIGRQHKSNNIYFIVDCESLTYEQRCYDFDCLNYRSEKIKINNLEKLNDEKSNTGEREDEELLKMIAENSELLEMIDENEFNEPCSNGNLINDDFPNFGITDEEMVRAEDFNPN